MNTNLYPVISWNDGAAAAANKIVDFPKPAPALAINEIRHSFTLLENDYASNPDSGMLSLSWAGVGNSAMRYARHTGHGFELNELVETLVRKQRDYGHQNILRFGTYGVIVRCHDKIARLEHLLGNNKVPNNESIRDNLMDVAGYAAIGIMLNHGWFEKELEDPYWFE